MLIELLVYIMPYVQSMYFSLSYLFQELSKVQDNEVGDGTTSVTVLACELLRV